MKSRIITITIFSAIFSCFLYSCSGAKNERKYEDTAFSHSTAETSAKWDDTLTLHLAVNDTYCKSTACKCIGDLACREYDTLQQILLDKYKIKMILDYFIEEYDLVNAISSNKYSGAICKPWFVYKDSTLEINKFKRIADILDIDNNQWLSGNFIVKKSSPINSLKDIGGKVIVIGQYDSYEKYHMPLEILKKEGVVPSSIINKASCLENVGMLLDNNADVAVISDYALTASCVVDVAGVDDFKVIHSTDKIPLCSVILDMTKISEKEAVRFQKALMELSGPNPIGGMNCKGFLLPAKWTPNPILGENK